MPAEVPKCVEQPALDLAVAPLVVLNDSLRQRASAEAGEAGSVDATSTQSSGLPFGADAGQHSQIPAAVSEEAGAAGRVAPQDRQEDQKGDVTKLGFQSKPNVGQGQTLLPGGVLTIWNIELRKLDHE